jgi:pimeloyl-ACP methyl ester carboxylesterase
MKRIEIETDRLLTSCWVSGPVKGTPVLLLHGNLVTGRFWRDVADRLPSEAHVVAPDLRGFGRTEAKPVDATRGLDDWIDDIEALVKALGWTGGQLHLVYFPRKNS